MAIDRMDDFTKKFSDIAGDYISKDTTNIKDYLDSQPRELRNFINENLIPGIESEYVTKNENQTKANVSDVYTKSELDPYLRGGDTVIKYEVFTIVSSNNGDGTFTYKDKNNITITGTLTAEGYQVFTLKDGTYPLNQNRIECVINDTLQRSVVSGGLVELSSTTIALTMPEGNGAEVTFKYYEKIDMLGNGLISIGSTNPGGGFIWFKVVE